MKYFLLGFGAVGQSFLRIFQENETFDPEVFYVIDSDRSKLQPFLARGGKEDHFIEFEVDENNYAELLRRTEPGDFFIDLAEELRNIRLLEYCLEHGIHYLNASDSFWKDDLEKEEESIYQHFLQFQNTKKNCPSQAATSIIEFGMNPGLVSAFVKAAIDEVIEKDSSPFVEENRSLLRELAEAGRYNKAASLLKIRKIIEIDHDDQKANIPREEGVLYSAWSPIGFSHECMIHPQIAFGSEEELHACREACVRNEEGRYALLEGRAIDREERVYSPQGVVSGCVTAHEEIFPIREYLRCGEDMPTVYFVYSPCEYAKQSLAECNQEDPDRSHILTRDEIVSGGESVGMILIGDHFHPRYYGNYLLTGNVKETATVVQVSASLFAAYQYMKDHPNLGMLFPEDVDHREVLKTALKYLGSYISREL